ncbi:unnamed protein product [Vitrella brassicaformis CCMP3155]|uniref:RING-type domain-containing protein n=1 Tax=Vitrella brassicaformis (strain CCMP3155) TaxID=1169540 RepID=A0A0G4EAB2_VITBC|nr:unnamed protein product [Vitrella brassicaformis CCMP3155]|eukprot:CEL92415.1 unnamed protein product [Vitrella brassicaformis CCMP3155]
MSIIKEASETPQAPDVPLAGPISASTPTPSDSTNARMVDGEATGSTGNTHAVGMPSPADRPPPPPPSPPPPPPPPDATQATRMPMVVQRQWDGRVPIFLTAQPPRPRPPPPPLIAKPPAGQVRTRRRFTHQRPQLHVPSVEPLSPSTVAAAARTGRPPRQAEAPPPQPSQETSEGSGQSLSAHGHGREASPEEEPAVEPSTSPSRAEVDRRGVEGMSIGEKASSGTGAIAAVAAYVPCPAHPPPPPPRPSPAAMSTTRCTRPHRTIRVPVVVMDLSVPPPPAHPLSVRPTASWSAAAWEREHHLLGQMRREKEELMRQLQEAKRKLASAADDAENIKCAVCLDNRRKVVLIPCHHLRLSAECAGELMWGPPAERLCPICRQPITKTEQVFV